MAKYLQGYFKPKYPEKYKGNPTEIIYRSSYELGFMSKLDLNPNVLSWQSETMYIWYRSPIDGKAHRYYPDFQVTVRNKEGVIEKLMIEIKPKVQTVPPKVQMNAKPTKRYLNEVKAWGTNSAKWEAAQAYCQKHGIQFRIFHEDHLGIK